MYAKAKDVVNRESAFLGWKCFSITQQRWWSVKFKYRKH